MQYVLAELRIVDATPVRGQDPGEPGQHDNTGNEVVTPSNHLVRFAKIKTPGLSNDELQIWRAHMDLQWRKRTVTHIDLKEAPTALLSACQKLSESGAIDAFEFWSAKSPMAHFAIFATQGEVCWLIGRWTPDKSLLNLDAVKSMIRDEFRDAYKKTRNKFYKAVAYSSIPFFIGIVGSVVLQTKFEVFTTHINVPLKDYLLLPVILSLGLMGLGVIFMLAQLYLEVRPWLFHKQVVTPVLSACARHDAALTETRPRSAHSPGSGGSREER